MSNGRQHTEPAVPDVNVVASPGSQGSTISSRSPRANEEQPLGNFTGRLAPNHQRLLDDLAALVDDYRNGRLDKAKTYTELFGRISGYDDGDISPGQKITAFASYSRELESAEANIIRASERGRPFLPAERAAAAPRAHNERAVSDHAESSHKRHASGSPERGGAPQAGDAHPAYELSRFIEPGGPPLFAEPVSRADSNPRIGGGSSIAADEDDDTGTHDTKRVRRAIEANMPWYNRADDPDAMPIRASCTETIRLLREYHNDIPGTRFLIEMARGSPAGFPPSQWDRILRGQPLDLNAVLSSIHRTSIDEEAKGCLGDQEIRIVISDTKRVVRTSIDWVSAWKRAAAAYSFAFPHRAKEVTAYGDYIEGEFEAKVVSSHHKVISFDKAIRNYVGAGQHILLTDDYKFSKFYSSILMSDGSRADDAQRDANNKPRGTTNTGPRKPGGKVEICRRFNGAKGCDRADGECSFRHICDLCKKSGHSAQKCNNSEKK